MAPVASGSSGADGLADIPLASDAAGNPLLAVRLPANVGMQVTSTPVTGAGLADQVNTAVASIASSNPTLGATVTSGLQDAFGTTPPPSLVVRSLTVTTSGTATPDQPIQINGSAGGNEALVIDVSQLPSGTVLSLNNVAFAVIVGNTTLGGGEGRNIVFADGGRQFIVLGPDDDELHGGGGDDTIGSKGGDDKLWGDAGNDIVVGGIGNDQLWGGDGNDILQGGASDAGQWTFKLDAQGQLQANFEPTSRELADSTGFAATGTWTVPAGQSHDPGAISDARLNWIYSDYGVAKDVALLAHALLGRLPSLEEMGGLAGGQFTSQQLGNMVNDYFASISGIQTQSVDAQLSAVINQVWGPNASTAELVSLGKSHLAAGGTWADIWLVLASHSTHAGGMTDAQGNTNLTNQTLGETGWSPNAGDNQLFGGAGNDVLIGGSGTNLLDGGTGTDLAVFFGVASDYQVARSETGGRIDLLIKHAGSGAINTLRDVEYVQIGTQVIATSAIAAATTNLPADGAYMDLQPVVAQVVGTVGSANLQGIGFHPEWLV